MVNGNASKAITITYFIKQPLPSYYLKAWQRMNAQTREELLFAFLSTIHKNHPTTPLAFSKPREGIRYDKEELFLIKSFLKLHESCSMQHANPQNIENAIKNQAVKAYEEYKKASFKENKRELEHSLMDADYESTLGKLDVFKYIKNLSSQQRLETINAYVQSKEDLYTLLAIPTDLKASTILTNKQIDLINKVPWQRVDIEKVKPENNQPAQILFESLNDLTQIGAQESAAQAQRRAQLKRKTRNI